MRIRIGKRSIVECGLILSIARQIRRGTARQPLKFGLGGRRPIADIGTANHGSARQHASGCARHKDLFLVIHGLETRRRVGKLGIPHRFALARGLFQDVDLALRGRRRRIASNVAGTIAPIDRGGLSDG